MKSSDASRADVLDRLTTKTFWDRTWSRPAEGRQRARRIRRLESLDWQMARLLVETVASARSTGGRLSILEIGCANSIWLPFLGRQTGGEVVGVDFSERGCRLAELNLAAMNIKGTIVCADFVDYVRRAPSSCDVVVSFGLIEHFSDVSGVLSTMVKLLKPGGVLLATVPNLAGVYGPMQQVIDAEVLRQHVILTPGALAEHGRQAGLVNVTSGYVGGPLRLSALNLAHVSWLPALVSRVIVRGLFELDSAVSTVLRVCGRDIAPPAHAPYAYMRGAAETEPVAVRA